MIEKNHVMAKREHKYVEVPRGAMIGWKNKKPIKPPQIVWLLGRPAAGKSFLADYLATQGWEAIDGDFLQESKDPKDVKMWTDVFECFQEYWCKEKECPNLQKWQPFIKILCDKALKGAKTTGKNQAIGFAIYHKQTRDYARKLIPDLKFIQVDASTEVLLERNVVRTEKVMASQGMTLQDMWAMDDPEMEKIREQYG